MEAAGALAGEWEWGSEWKEMEDMEDMEETLRCQICGDFFSGPVILPCSHTFCSTCVRKFMQSCGFKSVCPSCRKPVEPRQLIPNRILENLVQLFKSARPKLLHKLQKVSDDQAEDSGNDSDETFIPEDNFSLRSTRNNSTPDATVAPARIKQPFYNQMKDKEIKEMMYSAGLPTGIRSRSELIALHREYVLLSNAQKDLKNPKTTAEIRKQVIDTDKARIETAKKVLATKRKMGIENKAGTSNELRSSFALLTEDIRNRKKSCTNNNTSSSSSSLAVPKNDAVEEKPAAETGHSSIQVPIKEPVNILTNKQTEVEEVAPTVSNTIPVARLVSKHQNDDVTFVGSTSKTTRASIKSPTVLLSKEKWKCEMCTLINSRWDLTCNACYARKGTTPLKK